MKNNTTRSSIFLIVALMSLTLFVIGCGKKYDPIFSTAEKRAIQTAVITTSRVVKSPDYANCEAKGIAVFDNQLASQRIAGPLMAASGKRQDERHARIITDRLGEYNIQNLMAEQLYEALSERANYTVISYDEVKDLGWVDVNYKIDREIVSRKRDYRGLAKTFSADVVIDLRIVEWALVRSPMTDDVKLRLRVRVKIIHFPTNKLLYHNEFTNEFDERRLGRTVDYYKGSISSLKAETFSAIEQIIRDVIQEVAI